MAFPSYDAPRPGDARRLRSLPVRTLSRWLAVLATTLLAACSGGSSVPAPTGPGGPSDSAAITATVQANASRLGTMDPAGVDMSDLAAFGAAVGDSRLVLLTEATHGDGATFELKTRLVKYLHEHKGFDVLFMESGLYDVARIQQRVAVGGDSISMQAPGRIFYMYSRTTAGQQVLQYVDATRATATPLALWGHDIPMDGGDSTQSLVSGLAAFLAARGSALPASADWPAWTRVAQQGVALQGAAVSSADSGGFLAMSAQIAGELCATPDDGGDLFQSAAFWCRMAKGVQADYTHLWSGTDARTPTDLRDVTGAGNIEWLLDGRLSGRKAIVWLHAVHGDNALAGNPNCASAASQQCGPGWTNVGTELVKAYGADAVYIVNLTAGGGVYDTYNTASACGAPTSGYTLQAPGASTLEGYLGAGGQPMFMRYPSDAAGQQSIAGLSVREADYRPVVPSAFGVGYRGLFYLPQLQPVATDCTAYPVRPYS
jgi:erythromycin esterase-like protein